MAVVVFDFSQILPQPTTIHLLYNSIQINNEDFSGRFCFFRLTILTLLCRLRVQLGVNMPAQANRKLMEDKVEETEVELFEVYDVVLYMGIIDILQEYNLRKKIEHAYKSLQFDPVTISVVEPKFYAERFINFLENKVFPEIP